MLYYTKSLHKREKVAIFQKERSIEDLKLLIKKYRVQLQRSIGDLDILTNELNSARNDIKNIRAKNSQQRLENDQLISKIKELEDRIEALI
jgi:chromosome segregation ATPase